LYNRQQRLIKSVAQGKTGSGKAFNAPNGATLHEKKLFPPLF
jgi:hypothetical protein